MVDTDLVIILFPTCQYSPKNDLLCLQQTALISSNSASTETHLTVALYCPFFEPSTVEKIQHKNTDWINTFSEFRNRNTVHHWNSWYKLQFKRMEITIFV